MFDERIDRYIAEDMDPAERKAFEAELEQSDSLREELAEARAVLALAGEWFNESAPGADRVAGIPVPQVQRPKARVYTVGKVVSWAIKAAALLAIFLAGYATRAAKNEKPEEKIASPSPEVIPVTPETEQEKPGPQKAQPDGGHIVASADDYQRITDNNGELIMQTARSYWVVKPDQNLNDSTSSSEQR